MRYKENEVNPYKAWHREDDPSSAEFGRIWHLGYYSSAAEAALSVARFVAERGSGAVDAGVEASFEASRGTTALPTLSGAWQANASELQPLKRVPTPPPSDAIDGRCPKGARVVHPTCGAGTVVELLADGRTRVKFDRDKDARRIRREDAHKLVAEGDAPVVAAPAATPAPAPAAEPRKRPREAAAPVAPPPPRSAHPALEAVRALKRSETLTAKQVHERLPGLGFELTLSAVKKLCSEAIKSS